jgi:ApaG protein
MMQTAITRGVKVSVETFYQPDYSNPGLQEYMFAYRITITNESEHAVQLLRRHWYIFDSFAETKEVEGEGVVGQQPVIEPGFSYQYISGCNLCTEIGKMYGTYLMQRLRDGKMFYVTIPEFHLAATMKLN